MPRAQGRYRALNPRTLSHPTPLHHTPCLEPKDVITPHPTPPYPMPRAQGRYHTPPHSTPPEPCACARETQEGGVFARAHVNQKTRARLRPRL